MHNILSLTFINGAALEIEGLIWANILQENVPPERMRRVSSIDNLGSFALLPTDYAITGWAVDAIGAGHMFSRVYYGNRLPFSIIMSHHS